MMRYVMMLIVGIAVGLIARALLPGAQHMGFLVTGLMGVAGSYVGGLIGSMFSKSEGDFQPAGFIMSVIGAMIVIYGATALKLV